MKKRLNPNKFSEAGDQVYLDLCRATELLKEHDNILEPLKAPGE
jgi:hypothetical protein